MKNLIKVALCGAAAWLMLVAPVRGDEAAGGDKKVGPGKGRQGEARQKFAEKLGQLREQRGQKGQELREKAGQFREKLGQLREQRGEAGDKKLGEAGPHGMVGRGRHGAVGGLAGKLGLSEDQQTKLREALKGFFQERKAEFDKLREQHKELVGKLREGQRDQRGQLKAGLGELRKDLPDRGAMREKFLALIRPILNDEQNAKLDELLARRAAKPEKTD